jgi:glutamyl-tRNA reductase
MEDARPGQQIFDLGSPPQVVRSAEVAGARLVAIDDLSRTAEEATKRYRKKLCRLEEEATNAAVSVMSELETLSGETYKRLVLHRAERIVADRAERTSKRTGTDEETLRRMGWSIVKALLSPAFAESDPHARRLWKILAGELEESDDV